jgi:3-oxoacyl-[acyl-carrier protein] reductase
MRLDGLTALVTGGAQGIGAAIATGLYAEGAAVVVGDLEAAEPLGERAFATNLDVRSKESIEQAVAGAIERFGRLDILVNNAARISPTPLWEIGPDEWDDVLAVNLRGVFLASQVAGAHMRENGSGRIVNIASIAGQSGGIVGGAHYSASKGGLIALTKVFARELAARGVTVNAVAPAAIEGRVLDELAEGRREQIAASIPVGRFGLAEEVAAAVVYLASADAGFVTGATLDVNGGLLMR